MTASDPIETAILDELWNIRNSLIRVADVKEKGTGANKIMRESIHFLWEKHFSTKHHPSRDRSSAAKGLPNSALRFDHAVPLNIIMKKIFDSSCSRTEFERIIRHDIITYLITIEEDERLKKIGLNSKMPLDWDGEDWCARYKKAGIEI